jgi:bifunctional N-acetylglucosamine-1-phosphate-uridyltransferase/glucosamine-1-phosphate-acetyltransferase GlmU-like protein
MNTVIIPAAGSNARWGRNYPKQLAQIGRESIIQRLIRQCTEQGSMPLVLAHDKTLIAHLPVDTVILHPARHAWLVETLLASQTHWLNRVIILLGDVVFHPRLMRWIWTDHRQVQFYGTPAEIYALAFDRRFYGRISQAMHTALDYAVEHPDDGGAGKLWSVYKALTGQPQALEVQHIEPHFTFVKGEYTTDIDSPNEYELFLQEVVATGMLDDEVTV